MPLKPDPSPVTVSPRVVEAIKEFEGFRAKAYKDVGGVWTIGYGQAVNVRPTDVISEANAYILLLRRIAEFEQQVTDVLEVVVSQGQFDALVDFAYNEGTDQLKGSTLLKKLNEGDYEGAWREFPNWDFAAGRQMPGLLKRRIIEQTWFREGIEA